MKNNIQKIVIVVRAIFKFGDKYLVLEQVNASGNTYLLFPGGHAKEGESLLMALKREVGEELGIKCFKPKSLVFVKETLNPFDQGFEYFFECESKENLSKIDIKQKGMVGYEEIKSYKWMTSSELNSDHRFFPKDFFSGNNYQYLKINMFQYKALYGNDRNVKKKYESKKRQ